MSRKSAASLPVVALVPGQRPCPPKTLTDTEAAIWRATVATKPADWFTPDGYPLLLQYCRHAARADRIAERLALLDMTHGNALDAPDYDRLVAHTDRESKAITNLARQMRLTHQARIRPETAETAHRRAGSAERKPWQ